MRPVDPLTWRQVSPLLDRALDIEDGDLAGFLADVRAQQPDLAPILEDLLSEYGLLCRTEFLEFTPPAVSPETLPDSPYSLAGTVIGAYTLDVPLGAGGMGSVWHAKRTDGRFEGAVAVKLLHLAALDAGGAERFRREGTLLARLSHPHIAKLFDAGVTASGQPYLVPSTSAASRSISMRPSTSWTCAPGSISSSRSPPRSRTRTRIRSCTATRHLQRLQS